MAFYLLYCGSNSRYHFIGRIPELSMLSMSLLIWMEGVPYAGLRGNIFLMQYIAISYSKKVLLRKYFFNIYCRQFVYCNMNCGLIVYCTFIGLQRFIAVGIADF